MVTRVVIADDHAIMRDGLRSLLEKVENLAIVGEATTGREALETAKSLRPDIIIMDIEMPDLNGIDAARKIKKSIEGVQIIALSIHSEKQFVKGMLSAGASGYVLKASAFDELFVAIKAVISGCIYISPKVTGVFIEDYLNKKDGSVSVRQELSPREREVLQLISEGHAVKDISRILYISSNTVDTHRRRIMDKLDLHSVAELTKYAINKGITGLNL